MSTQRIHARYVSAVVAGALALLPGHSFAGVTVVGNVNVDGTAILAHVPVSGGTVSEPAANDAVKSLYATGLFEDVAVTSGRNAVVRVKEYPRVSSVSFEGNASLDSSVLSSASGIEAGDPLATGGLAEASLAVAARYATAARPDASVRARAVPSGQGTVAVVFSVAEGGRYGVEDIWFSGNSSFADAALRSVVTTKQTNLFSRFTGRDAYDIDRVDSDRKAIEDWYVSKGYAEVRVSRADVDRPSGKGFTVGFAIEEGPRYVLGAVSVDSTVGEFPVSPRVRKGDPLSLRSLADEADRLADAAFAKGVRGISVVPRVTYREDGLGDVEFQVDRAGQTYIERIEVTGNERTRDEVVLRELDFAEGDMLDSVLVRRAWKRLEATGHFETVRITVVPASAEDRVTMAISVKDRKTGEFSIGGGYSTKDGPIVNANLGDTNLSGTGRSARASVARGTDSTTFSLALLEPALSGSRASGGAEAFHATGDRYATGFTAYREDRTGAVASVTLPLGGPLSARFSYSATYRHLSRVDSRLTGNGTAMSPALVRPGGSLRSALGYKLSYDGTEAGRGFTATFGQDAAGLGGDVRQLRTEATAAVSSGKTARGFETRLSARMGHLMSLGGDVEFPDHFRSGPDLVRGFASDGFGPRDAATGYHLGGTAYAQATAEVRFPMPFVPDAYGFRGAAFMDAGSVRNPHSGMLASSGAIPVGNGGAFRASAGTGIIWDSPFGLLRADFAWPVFKQSGDREQMFSFSGGSRF